MPEPSVLHQPLARRYRPATFEGPTGLIGQAHVVRTLKNGLRTGRLPNAYLLTGPRGTGKTTTARVLAAALNCASRGPDLEPCRSCESCRRIIGGQVSTDVLEIDAATNRGADDARQLRQQAQYAPTTETGYKVYIVDEAHMLTREAWNALLKVLEEPPPRVLFVFCTTDPQKIAQSAEPILSRCQRLDLKRLGIGDIVGALRAVAEAEGIAVRTEALALIARRADGGMRDALSLLDQMRAFQGEGVAISAEAVRDALGALEEKVLLRAVDRLLAGDRAATLKLVRYLEEQGADIVRFLDDVIDAITAVLEVQAGESPKGWSDEGAAELARRAAAADPTRVGAMLYALHEDASLVRGAPRPGSALLGVLQQVIGAGPAAVPTVG